MTEMNEYTLCVGFSMLPAKSEKHAITKEKLALTLYDYVYYANQIQDSYWLCSDNSENDINLPKNTLKTFLEIVGQNQFINYYGQYVDESKVKFNEIVQDVNHWSFLRLRNEGLFHRSDQDSVHAKRNAQHIGRCIFQTVKQNRFQLEGSLSPFEWHHTYIQNDEELEKDMAIVFDAARKLSRTKDSKYAITFYSNKNYHKIKEMTLSAIQHIIKPLWGFIFSRWMYFEGVFNYLWFINPWSIKMKHNIIWQLPEYYVYPSQIDIIRERFFESINVDSFYMRHPIFQAVRLIEDKSNKKRIEDNGNRMLSVMINGYFHEFEQRLYDDKCIKPLFETTKATHRKRLMLKEDTQNAVLRAKEISDKGLFATEQLEQLHSLFRQLIVNKMGWGTPLRIFLLVLLLIITYNIVRTENNKYIPQGFKDFISTVKDELNDLSQILQINRARNIQVIDDELNSTSALFNYQVYQRVQIPMIYGSIKRNDLARKSRICQFLCSLPADKRIVNDELTAAIRMVEFRNRISTDQTRNILINYCPLQKDLAQINEQIKNNEMNYINNSSSNINDFNISNNNNTNNSLNIPSIPDLPETVNTNNKTNINAEKRALPRVSPCEKYTNQILRISQEKYKRRITGMDIINQYNRKYRIQNHNNITSIVTVGKLNNCSCDEWKDDVCDEFVWTLIKALKVPINSYLVYQKAFLEHELTQIFNNAPKLLESICGPLSQPKTQPSIIEHNTSHTGHGFFRNNKKRGRDEGKRQKLNNGSVKIMPNNPNIPYSTRDLMFKQLYGYNQYQMSNISDKGIFENDELQNNKKNNSQNYIHQSNKLSFTINELNEYKNTNKQICLSKDELDKYHWGSINQLCGVLKLTRGGKKKDMISRIMESKFYGK
eukprot:235616_1